MWLDAGLGLVAVVAVAATARYTREQIWAPPATERRDRLRHSTRHLLVGTSAVALLFAIVGSWTGRPGSLFKATMLGALVFFAPWAALQQMLFQFYLLGRLRALSPASPALTLAAINGVLFGAVHLPDVELTVLTSVGGAVWSWYYLRDRCLAPSPCRTPSWERRITTGSAAMTSCCGGSARRGGSDTPPPPHAVRTG